MKWAGMASSGGMAKSEIANGQVLVNGVVETRKRKKIGQGEVVEYGGEGISIR